MSNLNDTITCESTFVGNVFGYKTKTQWVFKLADNRWAEYLYVFADGKWMYSNTLGNPNSLQSLSDEVASLDVEDQFSADDISQIKDAISAFYGCA